jgi:hypothetical protein
VKAKYGGSGYDKPVIPAKAVSMADMDPGLYRDDMKNPISPSHREFQYPKSRTLGGARRVSA